MSFWVWLRVFFPPALACVLGFAGFSATVLAQAPPVPSLKGSVPLKQMLKPGVSIVEESPRAADEPPAARMTLAAYLRQQLGPKRYHTRSEWAGKSDKYKPVISGGRVWKPIGTVKYLTLHHSAGIENEHPAAMIRNIFTGHISPMGPLDGAADVGYHFFVDRNGAVWEGRDATKIGSHVGSTPPGRNNPGNIGICGLGTFMNEGPSKAMSDGLTELCALVAKYYGRPLEVRGHKDWKGINQFAVNKQVDCPGRLESVVERARKQIRVALGTVEMEQSDSQVAMAGGANELNAPGSTSTLGR